MAYTSRTTARGFTLVELVTVLVMVGILSAVAIARFSAPSDFSGPAHAEEVRAALAHARRTAVAARRFVCVSVSGNTLSLTMDPAQPDDRTTPSCSSANPVALPGRDATGELPSPTGVTTSSSPSSFHFKPSGEASAGAALTAGGVSVTLRAATGSVE